MGKGSRVALRVAVLSAAALGLALPAAAAPITSAGALRVARLFPAPGSRQVRLDGLVAVVFDRPVVSLARLGSGPPAAAIAPSLPGQGRWLGTSTWAIVPAHGLAPATSYMLRLNPTLRAVDGSVLGDTTPWRFATLRPAVASVRPRDGSRDVLPQAPVDVTFNMPVVHSSARAHFALRLHGVPLPGAFSWRDARTMRFTPAALLPRGSAPVVDESPGVVALGGPLPSAAAFHGAFGVAPAFALRFTEPSDGSSTVRPYLSVALHFTAPPDVRAASRYVRVQPALDALHVDVADANTLTIDGNFRPSTAYRVTIRAGLPGLLGDHLTATRMLRFTTAPYDPALTLFDAGSLNTYDAYRGARLYASVTNVDRVTFSLYRQDEAEFLRANASSFNRSAYTPDGLPLVARYTRRLRLQPNRAVTIAQPLTLRDGHSLPPGYYAVFASAPGVRDTQYLPLIVTRSALTLKVADHGVLLWATDLRSGAPLARLPVRVVDDSGRPVLYGRTGSDGVYAGAVPPAVHLANMTLRALLERPADAAAAGSEWSNGISPYDYNLPFDPTQNRVRLYLNTDRPIYRPGQAVMFRGLIRGDDDGRYHMLPPGYIVRVVATDALNHTVLDRSLPLGPGGIVAGQLPLPANAALGGYTLNATVSNESASAYFTVAAYKKPTFKVDVRADRGSNGNYVRGERIGISAHAAYYFGAPLADAPVQWSVSSAATSFQPPDSAGAGYDSYSFADTPDAFDYGQIAAPVNAQVSTFKGRTGAYGETALRLSSTIAALVQGQGTPRVVTVEANVTGPSGQQVAQRETVLAHPAGVYAGLRPRAYLAAPGTPQEVDVVTLRPDGTAAPRTAVKLALQRRRTYSVLRYDPQEGYIWQDHTRDDTLRAFTIITDGSGHAVARVVLPGTGEYRLAASARDRLGNLARSAAYLYSASHDDGGYTDWGIANNDRIRLVADRRHYTIGQTARVLVSAPYAGMRALVTTERGTILSHRVLTLRGNSSVLDIPITDANVPNMYVGVVLFKGTGTGSLLPVWKMGYTTLVVNPRERALTVTVRPSVPRARPGAHVTFALHASDAYGRPVVADLGVSLVDAAVLALAANANGTATDAFYAQRPLGVSTAANMSLFIDRLNLTPGSGTKGGSGGGANGGVRTKFPDTAYWNPDVVTDAAGNAMVALTLPDNLTTWRLGVEGSTTTKTLLGDGSAELISTKDLLVEPALPRFLTVRDHGHLGAVVSNTTGRAMRVAVGATLTPLPPLPRSVSGGRGVRGDSLTPQTVLVPAHQDRGVYWDYVPRAEGTLAVTLRARALSSGGADADALSDALRLSLPVEQNSLVGAEGAATSGDSSRAVISETVRLPGAIEPGEGELRLTLEPSLVAGLSGAAAYLLSYPYNCVEQLTSRLTGLLALASLPARSGLTPAQAAGLPALEMSTAAQLYGLQNGDGGWGWWSGDRSDPYLSAYAYEGLVQLRASGYRVDSSVLQNGARYLQGRLDLPVDSPDPYAPDDPTRARILAALALGGAPDASASASLYERRQGLGAGSRAALALALASAFGRRDPRVATLLRELSDAAKITSIDAHWEISGGGDDEVMESSQGDTALALRAFVTLDPRNPLIPRAVRWLVARRGLDGAGVGNGLPITGPMLAGDPAAAGAAGVSTESASGPPALAAWESTETTALALRALVAYALRAGDTRPRYAYTARLDGTTLAAGTVTPDTAAQARVVVMSTDVLRARGGRALLTITRRALAGGPAVTAMPLHYTLRLRYYPAPGSVGAVDGGISLTRRYLTGGAAAGTGAPAGDRGAAGSLLTVELRLIAPRDLSRVLIEDPLPAGAEAVDGTLLTSSVFAQPGGHYANPDASPAPGQPRDLAPYIDHSELRDDRAALFASLIPAGTYVYRYTIHLAMPGTYHVLPAYATQLYEPEVFGHTVEEDFTVLR